MLQDENYYIELAQKGMSYEEIKALAQANGIPKELLSELMRQVDDVVLAKGEEKASKSHALEWMFVGASLSLIAALMMLYSFIDSESYYIYIVYGCFLGGAFIFLTGWKWKKGSD